MLRKSQLILAAVLVIVASGTVSYAVSAMMPQAFLGPGTTRYAVAASVSTEYTNSNVFKTIPGMSVSFSIPAGKKGDVFVIFCADAIGRTDSALQVRAWIAGATGTPGYYNLAEDAVMRNHCATWFSTGVPAGYKNVKLEWRSSLDLKTMWLYQRNMIVIVNIR